MYSKSSTQNAFIIVRNSTIGVNYDRCRKWFSQVASLPFFCTYERVFFCLSLVLLLPFESSWKIFTQKAAKITNSWQLAWSKRATTTHKKEKKYESQVVFQSDKKKSKIYSSAYFNSTLLTKSFNRDSIFEKLWKSLWWYRF